MLPTVAMTAEATQSMMSKEQLKAFLEKVKGDVSLQHRLKAAKSSDDVVSIAKEHGHEFTVEKIAELSEEELEGVDGGGGTNPKYNGACGATHGYGIFCRG